MIKVNSTNISTLIALLFLVMSCTAQSEKSGTKQENDMAFKIDKSEAEWKEQLSPEQYYILREKGTERPGTGEYNMHFEDGVYHCSACNAELFKSDSKFDAHCGWPSFDQAISDSAIVEHLDKSHGMMRTEILCANCGGHLGHVFNDGPNPTGLRYCLNSAALEFKEEEEK
jgi:peptide-methionine (R)-S-oxide reductase